MNAKVKTKHWSGLFNQEVVDTRMMNHYKAELEKAGYCDPVIEGVKTGQSDPLGVWQAGCALVFLGYLLLTILSAILGGLLGSAS